LPIARQIDGEIERKTQRELPKGHRIPEGRKPPHRCSV